MIEQIQAVIVSMREHAARDHNRFMHRDDAAAMLSWAEQLATAIAQAEPPTPAPAVEQTTIPEA